MTDLSLSTLDEAAKQTAYYTELVSQPIIIITVKL